MPAQTVYYSVRLVGAAALDAIKAGIMDAEAMWCAACSVPLLVEMAGHRAAEGLALRTGADVKCVCTGCCMRHGLVPSVESMSRFARDDSLARSILARAAPKGRR
jgi:hypothetical protein